MEQTSTDSLVVDCRGLQCPAPILRLAEAVRKKRPPTGQLTVLANDADFPVDVAAWCRSTKAVLVRMERDAQGAFKAEILLGKEPRASTPGASADDTPPEVEGLEKTAPSRAAMPVRLLSRVNVEPPPVTPRATAETKPMTRAQVPPSVRVVEEPRAAGPASERRTLMTSAPRENRAVLLVLRNDLETLLPALMVANASAAQGMEVEVYFAFWGIHLLRGSSSRPVGSAERPSLLQRLLLWLVPEGPRQTLGKMHMGGFGTRLILRLMRRRNILALDGLVASAVSQGVRFRVCSMSMGLMGLSESDILDLPNVDFAGVTSFAEVASRSAVSLVF